MQIGDWEIKSFVSGAFRLDGGAMFGVVPKTMWSTIIAPDDLNRIGMVMRLWLVRGRGKTILVDAGCGHGYGEKITKIYGFESNYPMAESLAAFDVTPQEVTDVLVTHLHFDHGGGLANPDGDEWRLTFPNAIHHIQKAQWQHAVDPNPRDRASYFKQRIEIIEREGRLALVDGEWEFAPGIDFLTCHGHTPGQQLPRITGDGETILFGGDLLPLLAHFPPPYVMAYDLQPVLSMEEKVRVLKQAAAGNWIVFFEHDPDTEACRVVEQGGRFVPGESMSL